MIRELVPMKRMSLYRSKTGYGKGATSYGDGFGEGDTDGNGYGDIDGFGNGYGDGGDWLYGSTAWGGRTFLLVRVTA